MPISSWTPPPPPDPNTLRNPTPFPPFPLGQLRAGKIKKTLGTSRLESAIFKTPLSGPVTITVNGIVGDEHAYETHRSPDKALLHYCTAHYRQWSEEIPVSAHLFQGGAFGENMFTEEISEKTVCIGDRIAIGEQVIVEVSEPRAPCYKLNHRFEVRDMARRTQTLLRTGWLYRVVRPGVVTQGDVVRLLERPLPEWTVARVMYYLFLETGNTEMMSEIVGLGPLGVEIKDKFLARLAKGGAVEDQNGRMFGGEEDKMDAWSEYRIVEKRRETSTVTAFVLEALDDMKCPDPVLPGSHVRLKLGGNLVRAYSVVAGTSKRFELGIALDASSRGGSKFLHEQTTTGDILTASRIHASFPLAPSATQHIFIAGGIGLTAFLTALHTLHSTSQPFHLHYAIASELPFKPHIAALAPHVTLYNKSRAQRIHLPSLLAHTPPLAHIYTCGPERLMHAVRHAALARGIPPAHIHSEAFTLTTSGAPFTAELKQSGKVVDVGAQQTLLDALRAVGMVVDSSCEVGNCGTCRVEDFTGGAWE
ncbi:PK beta-barrel-protein domain-containing protein-like protein [Dothidotthia symphoricarpi CBS 119687]|uniref:PK beta-barrel-protein domain-containing protein-like protein n=1 Tax=Dothidotthia symphoricarpi CBS 119687 TaxID=1392245 RepID=A0A6A6A8B1_9PLEO|nr:PK beta-barrel-protein domain-containing protein-like protein [Dothidotthia symphoricarpi CBS 119687]KAF2127048.1 PK beta-barrel-protein domain-containing protein-like protein [Dothidotthia symphoricarpi CBS 119687]